MDAPAPVAAVVDHDANTITVAYTFKLKPWVSTDRCEMISLTSRLRQILADGLAVGLRSDNPVASFTYQSWEPDEETQLGFLPDYSRGFCTGCGAPMVTTSEPPWFAHVINGPTDDAAEACDNIENCVDPDGYVIRFANTLEVDFGQEDS